MRGEQGARGATRGNVAHCSSRREGTGSCMQTNAASCMWFRAGGASEWGPKQRQQDRRLLFSPQRCRRCHSPAASGPVRQGTSSRRDRLPKPGRANHTEQLKLNRNWMDDSGTNADSSVSIMAGYVAHVTDWKSFERKANAIRLGANRTLLQTQTIRRPSKQFQSWEPRSHAGQVRFGPAACPPSYVGNHRFISDRSTGFAKAIRNTNC